MWKLGLSSSYLQHCPYSVPWRKYKVGHMSSLKVYFQATLKVLLCLQYHQLPHRISIRKRTGGMCVIGKKGEFQNWEKNLSGENLSLFCEMRWWAVLWYEEPRAWLERRARQKQASFWESQVAGGPAVGPAALRWIPVSTNVPRWFLQWISQGSIGKADPPSYKGGLLQSLDLTQLWKELGERKIQEGQWRIKERVTNQPASLTGWAFPAPWTQGGLWQSVSPC